MKKSFFFFLALINLFSYTLSMDRTYETTNKKVTKLVSEPSNRIAYALLRASQAKRESDSTDARAKRLYSNALELWTHIKQNNAIHKNEILSALLLSYSDFLTPEQLDCAEATNLYEKTIWDKSTRALGSTVTTLLQASSGLALVTLFAICPAAALVSPFANLKSLAKPESSRFFDKGCEEAYAHALQYSTALVGDSDALSVIATLVDKEYSCEEIEQALLEVLNARRENKERCGHLQVPASDNLFKGSFKDSCSNICTFPYRSSDKHIPGDLIDFTASCRYDRHDHGEKQNKLVLPANGFCDSLYNINGTIIAAENEAQAMLMAKEMASDGCPDLAGSFSRTCDYAQSEPYHSSDDNIQDGLFCRYEVKGCKKLSKGTRDNTFVLSKAEAQCLGSKLENCDGKLLLREKGQSDSQCEGARSKPSAIRDEL